MAHTLLPLPIPSSPPQQISAAAAQWKKNSSLIPPSEKSITTQSCSHLHRKREFIYGLVAAGVGYSLTAVESANAAAKRPPPPPPQEKKDPSVSGVRAKVIASMKRKEAMKEEIARLREKGKPVN